MSETGGKPKVVVVVGPTGSGKTDLALHIAKRFRGELIAADSRTVYRGMDIGTAKPPCDAPPPLAPPPGGKGRNKMDVLPLPSGGGARGGGYLVQGIPHHLLDVRSPDQPYSVSEFKTDAEKLIREIIQRGKLPIVVGGTGLYIRALVDNLTIPEIPAQLKLRESFELKSNRELLTLLRQLDPNTARTIDRKNKRRIIRALEVCIFTGQPFSALRTKGEPLFEFLEIGIQRTRAALYRRIDQRIRVMFREGLIKEVEQLVRRYGPDIEPLRGIIYREVVEHLRTKDDGRVALRALAQRIMFANHRYARHQLMWFKKDARIHWVRTARQAERLVRNFL